MNDDASGETSAVTVRPATPEDAPQIAQLMEPAMQRSQLLPRSRQEITDLTRYGFVALCEGEVVGFCAAEIYSRKLAEIQGLIVDPRFRSQGVGKQLVRQSVKRARELGVLEVMAITANEDFLRSCGFDYALPEQKKALFCQLRPRPSEEQ